MPRFRSVHSHNSEKPGDVSRFAVGQQEQSSYILLCWGCKFGGLGLWVFFTLAQLGLAGLSGVQGLGLGFEGLRFEASLVSGRVFRSAVASTPARAANRERITSVTPSRTSFQQLGLITIIVALITQYSDNVSGQGLVSGSRMIA